MQSVPITVRSFAKINLGLCIGSMRPDGFHELRTVYQTIALHDLVRVRVSRGTGIEIRCDDPRVPRDQSNTCWRMVERAVEALGVRGRVVIEIEKRLPVQGGLGGASGNAVASLLGLEMAAKKKLSGEDRLRIAAGVGSDLPLFLIGGTVLGCGRGEEVYPLPDLPAMPCVIAMPEVGVSTPQAFADWDLGLCGADTLARETSGTKFSVEKATAELRSTRTAEGGRPYTFKNKNENVKTNPAEHGSAWTGRSARPHTGKGKNKGKSVDELTGLDPSDRMNLFSCRISAGLSSASGVPVSKGRGRVETPLLDLVRTGIGNDFELVVFPKYPELREAKSVLEGAGAFYASLSGSGSAVYGLFETRQKAETGAAALNKRDIPAVVTSILTRSQYWKRLRIED